MSLYFFIIWGILIGLEPAFNQAGFNQNQLNKLIRSHGIYIEQLSLFRDEFGGGYSLPAQDFFLFGMGNRDKLLYRNGQLYNAISGERMYSWDVMQESIFPSQYTVFLDLLNGERISIHEDAGGIWLAESGKLVQINERSCRINLPDFKEHRYSEILKVLHQEILVNIVDSKPLPNYFVYQKPWRRDAAMMAMCLSYTGNLELIRDWVLSLEEPYDYNNGQKQGSPESETDNLGQTLYLISLFSDRSFPLVPIILREVKKYEVTAPGMKYVSGRSDFQEVPVYQTKWLKFGLKALELDDPYSIPRVPDNYSSLFWWDYKEEHMGGNEGRDAKYPYIGWARDHFYGQKNGLISDRIYPLTWEKEASQADYEGMRLVYPEYVVEKIAAPHTWHASEIFLYMLDLNLNR